MDEVMEMASEVRRTLILCSAISLCGCSDFFRWVSGRRHLLSRNRLVERNDFRSALILDQSRFGHLAMPIGPVIGINLTGGGHVASR